MNFLEQNDVVQALPPTNDLFTSSPSTKPVSLKNYDHVCFQVEIGGGAGTGRGTITAYACDDEAGDNPVAIPFRYRSKASQTAAWSAYSSATASGFETAAGHNQLYGVEIDARELLQAASESSESASKPYCFLTLTEAVSGAEYGSVTAIMSKPRYVNTVPAPSVFA